MVMGLDGVLGSWQYGLVDWTVAQGAIACRQADVRGSQRRVDQSDARRRTSVAGRLVWKYAPAVQPQALVTAAAGVAGRSACQSPGLVPCRWSVTVA